MDDKVLKRLTAQQVVIYMKLKKLEKKLEGSTSLLDISITTREFEREVEKVLERLND
jgi:transcription initiation factor IIE alpha subunit